jgi:hypothetical protein
MKNKHMNVLTYSVIEIMEQVRGETVFAYGRFKESLVKIVTNTSA